MSDDDNALELADFTGLLIDNTLSALIKSLESQLQWREQITAIDGMDDDEIFESLTDEDVDNWLVEISPNLIDLFAKWRELNPKDPLNLQGENDFVGPLVEVLTEIGMEIPETLKQKNAVLGAEYPLVSEAIRLHLVDSTKRRLSMMKEMGLPTLVADKVEIKSKMNLVSERKSGATSKSVGTPIIGTPVPVEKGPPGTGRRIAAPSFDAAQDRRLPKPTGKQGKIARPVKNRVFGKLSDLEQIRERIGATKTHSVKIAANPISQNSENHHVNAEISIILRSHFF